MENYYSYLLVAAIIYSVGFICINLKQRTTNKRKAILEIAKDKSLPKRKLHIAYLSFGIHLASIILIPISLWFGGQWLVEYEYKARAMENTMNRIAAQSDMLDFGIKNKSADTCTLFSLYRQSLENISCKNCPQPFEDAFVKYKSSLKNLEQTMHLSIDGWRNKTAHLVDKAFNDGKLVLEKKNRLEELVKEWIKNLKMLTKVYQANRSFLHGIDPIQYELSNTPEIKLNTPTDSGAALYQAVEDKIEYTLRKDSKRWKVSDYKYNTVTILDAQYLGDDKIDVKGTFIYDLPVVGPDKIIFDATLKKILDDVNVVKMSWVQPTGAIWCIGDCDYQY